MLIIREVFTAKPGHASKLVSMMKADNAAYPAMKSRVLTDYAAERIARKVNPDKVTMAEFDRHMHEYQTNTALRETLKGYTELWLTGRREVYRVV